ncbi:tRNA1(Val) (adenine(37)-N6)-methyltransferase [Echinimonas agarilytica]|uniref:tRNA1(Val) (adenine(37)-N6)-methyltransferase n=1 Tax=Echinimonas agarilytica TaxID=1215918 RepID=A0AA42B8R6_9GAMM|nr:methyltransferase [Echinimonas agarilytica]MCM2681340.1 methyltransferase [Echinimonas agarilytica]
MTGFRCKEFFVAHDRCGMKVGTDSLILGSWLNVHAVRTVLDMGAGSGILSMMVAQRALQAEIDAVEIDQDAAEQAQDNFLNTPWNNRLRSIHGDVTQWHPVKKYDLIVSNPPYFLAGQTLNCVKRQQARLDEQLPIDRLLDQAGALAHDHTRIALVLPMERLSDVESWAQLNQWSLHRVLHIQTRADKMVRRVAIELVHVEASLMYEQLCIMDENNQYTAEFKSLTKAFYLAF